MPVTFANIDSSSSWCYGSADCLQHNNEGYCSMCFSATVSYSATAVLVSTGLYAVHQADGMSVSVRENSIHYSYIVPYRSSIHLPVTPAALYALTLLVPLFFSSHGKVRIFGMLIASSMTLTSVAYSAAYVSVWCFFAALLSLHLVYMIRDFASKTKPTKA